LPENTELRKSYTEIGRRIISGDYTGYIGYYYLRELAISTKGNL